MRSGAVLGLLFGLAAGLALVACASPRAGEAPPPRTMESLAGPYDQEKAEITLLWGQIRGWRVDQGMQPEPPFDLMRQTRHIPVKKLRICPENPDPASSECRDVCSIADAICENAESICRIASQLDGDAWATDKCNSAKASCKQATERCCDCASEEDRADPAGEP
jgi:hypothetical protein